MITFVPKISGGVSMEKFKEWIEESLWAWRNCIDFRLQLEDNIDRCSFFYELNIGWYDMYGDPELDSRDPYNLSGRDSYYSYVMKKK
jgi:hypothetical protein